MKRGCLIALGVVGGLVVILLLAALIADQKYEFLWASPVNSHDALVAQDTCVQLVIRPETALAQIPKLFPNSKVPPTFLGKVLPYEIALLCSADSGAESADVTVFVNDRRLGPMIRQAANASMFRGVFPSVTWTSESMQREKRGKLILTGAIPIDKATNDAVTGHWSALSSFNKPLEVDAKHLIELALDNRSGGVFALMASLPKAGSPESASFRDENTIKLFAGVSVARLTADLAEGNTATVDVDIQTNPQANMIFALKLLLDGAIPQLNESLKRSYGASIDGKSTTEDNTIKGHYTITNVDRILSAASGAGGKVTRE